MLGNYTGEVLRDMNLFVGGIGKAGLVDEVTLPKVTTVTADHNGGGMAGPIEIPTGIDKLETDFTMAGIDPETMILFGLTHNKAIALTFRGAIDDGGEIKPVIAVMTGIVKEVETTTKKGEKIASKFSLNLSYYSLTVNALPIYLIDKINNIVMIGGTDMNADVRDAIGQ